MLVLSHGSRRPEANDLVVQMVRDLRKDLNCDLVELAFLQLAYPDVETGLGQLLSRGCDDILVLSMFLVSGNHHTHDCGAKLRRILDRYPGVRFSLTEPLMLNRGLYRLIVERCLAEMSPVSQMNEAARCIEEKSFAIVDGRLAGLEKPEPESQVVRRVAHATADPDLARSLIFHPDAVSAAVDALARGRHIVADSRMVAAGIDRSRLARLGANLTCCLCSFRAARLASESGLTRSQAAMREALNESPAAVVVVGNAPTALDEVLDSIDAGRANPPVVIGVPVGFVGASEAKQRLSACRTPFITNAGPRGGSAVAVAITNALLRLADSRVSVSRAASSAGARPN